MVRDIRRAIVALLALTVLLGGVYPVAIWAIGQVAFNDQAHGSLVVRNGTVVGSSLIAQSLHERPLLPPATVCGRLQRERLRRLEPRPERAGPGRRRQAATGRRREDRAASRAALGARRPRDRVGVRARSRHLAPGGPDPGRPRGARPRLDPAKVRALVQSRVDSPTARPARRDPRQRARPQPRARSTCRGDRERPDSRPGSRVCSEHRRAAGLAAFVRAPGRVRGDPAALPRRRERRRDRADHAPPAARRDRGRPGRGGRARRS